MADKRTYRDRSEYFKRAVDKRRKKIRSEAIKYRGGKCELCGYKRCSRAFDFHHLDPKKKKFGISLNGLTRSWERVRHELDNCIMLCANCHREVHAGITQLPRVIGVEKRGELSRRFSRNPAH
jgi:predicted HNH restriction endonuclease